MRTRIELEERARCWLKACAPGCGAGLPGREALGRTLAEDVTAPSGSAAL